MERFHSEYDYHDEYVLQDAHDDDLRGRGARELARHDYTPLPRS